VLGEHNKPTHPIGETVGCGDTRRTSRDDLRDRTLPSLWNGKGGEGKACCQKKRFGPARKGRSKIVCKWVSPSAGLAAKYQSCHVKARGTRTADSVVAGYPGDLIFGYEDV